MDDKEQFTNLVAKHASGLTEEQLAGYDACSTDGECVTPSYEVFRGIVPAIPDEFLEMAISLNAIHPDEYLTDMLLKPHEVIGALADEGDQLNNATPVYFFPDTGVYAAAVSETRVLDAALLAMLPGELVTRPLELHRQDTNLTDPVAGRLSQLHVLIPQAPAA